VILFTGGNKTVCGGGGKMEGIVHDIQENYFGCFWANYGFWRRKQATRFDV